MHARDVTQLDRLAGQGKRPGNYRLRCNHRGQRGQHHQRDQRPAGGQQIERVTRSVRVFEQQCALSKVVKRQRRQHQNEPRPCNRLATKVPHVGVQRLGPGQGQDHGAQNGHAHARVRHKKAHAPNRVQRVEHFRVLGYPVNAQPAQYQKPHHHHRAKQLANAGSTVALNQKQQHQHHQREGHYPVVQAIKRQLKPFNRG